MTQTEKELLVKDLCGRLPYGVKINENTQGDFTLIGLTKERVFTTCEVEGCHNDFPIENIKPYLFPLSSMTKEQKKEYSSLVWFDEIPNVFHRDDAVILDEVEMLIKFYHKNHLDYNGLIPNGLANNATGLNIYS